MRDETCLWRHAVNYSIRLCGDEFVAPFATKSPFDLNLSGNYTALPDYLSTEVVKWIEYNTKRNVKSLRESLLLLMLDLQSRLCLGWGSRGCAWLMIGLRNGSLLPSPLSAHSPAPALGSSWGMQPCLTWERFTGGVRLSSRGYLFRMKIHSCLQSVLPRCLSTRGKTEGKKTLKVKWLCVKSNIWA